MYYRQYNTAVTGPELNLIHRNLTTYELEWCFSTWATRTPRRYAKTFHSLCKIEKKCILFRDEH
jgi:hypothetical protein